MVSSLAVAEIKKKVDLVTLYNSTAGSPLFRTLRSGPFTSLSWTVRSYVVGLEGFNSWEEWLKSKSKNFRQNLGGQRRNLSKLGQLLSVEDEAAIIPWVFSTKRRWLRAVGKQSRWIDYPKLGEEFFTTLYAQSDNPLKLFALKLNGTYIAAGLCLVSSRRLEYYITTYAQNDELERYSPGMLVSEDCGRWALNHGLDLDFRFMEVPYKDRWTSRVDEFVSVSAALHHRAAATVWTAKARQQVRGLRRRVGSFIKAARRTRQPARARQH
jgi:CelD/BcsL family acetyltransferase involved in cellulose biosynthesis